MIYWFIFQASQAERVQLLSTRVVGANNCTHSLEWQQPANLSLSESTLMFEFITARITAACLKRDPWSSTLRVVFQTRKLVCLFIVLMFAKLGVFL